MAEPSVPEVDLARLGPLTRIGVGGQGTVYAPAQTPDLVFKEYAPQFVDDVDVASLVRFVQLADRVDESDADVLRRLAAWPVAIVRKGGVVRGFLMPRVPDDYRITLDLPSGPATVLAQAQYLLNSEEYLHARGLDIGDRFRMELLRDTAEALALFHRFGIAVGDFSPNNLLFSATVRPRCYFIDCDAMRLDGDSVLAQAETPEWQVPSRTGDDPVGRSADRPATDGTGDPGPSRRSGDTGGGSDGPALRPAVPAEELATAASDAYKLGLFAVRLFAGHQHLRDPAAAAPYLPRTLRVLAARSLDPDPDRRVPPAQWIAELDSVINRIPDGPRRPPLRRRIRLTGLRRNPAGDRPGAARAGTARAAGRAGAGPAGRTPGATGYRPGQGVGAATARRASTIAVGRPAWEWIVPLFAILVAVIAGVVNSGDGGDGGTSVSRLPTGAPYRSLLQNPAGAPEGTGLPRWLPTAPGLPGIPDLSRLGPTPFRLPLPLICIFETEIGPGLSKDSPRVGAAALAVSDLLCAISADDQEQAFAGRAGAAPDATQRNRFAELVRRGPYPRATLIGLRTGAGGRPEANVVFHTVPESGGRATCWRSRLTLAPVESELGVVSLTAPESWRCG
ncbi:hypothetical protein [Micromonospora sp. NBC_01796]|uniref:hypothetical protein n=1 Tax=Micromonospora sp. NBC_01796 TaxID=2975987 RepID=UPI002DD8737D|nr:hypothetical protein [Micromonospora sp. NBC_01796]WSA84842.1 hypothetical protein OIE47_31520 [Micromonospora sp. NBC_01796]